MKRWDVWKVPCKMMRPRASSAYGGDYEEVVKYLRMCYDKEKLVYRHHIREILICQLSRMTTTVLFALGTASVADIGNRIGGFRKRKTCHRQKHTMGKSSLWRFISVSPSFLQGQVPFISRLSTSSQKSVLPVMVNISSYSGVSSPAFLLFWREEGERWSGIFSISYLWRPRTQLLLRPNQISHVKTY